MYPPNGNVRAVRTFQGRPLATAVDRTGQRVEIAEGVRACKLKDHAAAAPDRGFIVMSAAGRPPALGIAVVPEAALRESGATELGGAVDRVAPDIEWTEPLYIDRGSALPDDPYVPQQWALDAIRALPAWQPSASLERIVLAVLDSGVPIEAGQLSHSDLQDAGRLQLGRDVVNGDADPADDHGHGTHVLGIIGATPNNGIGIAGLWPGPVLILKVFDSGLAGSSVTFKDGVAAAIDFARARGARLVINYSGGGPDSQVKRTAVEYAGEQGALLVAAAGNGHGGPIEFPAAYAGGMAHVVAVGATMDQGQPAGLSSAGPEMTVAAPGVGVLSTLPNYAVTLTQRGLQTKYDRASGTSQAAPHVAALAALVWARRPDWTAAQVRQRITTTTDQVPGATASQVGAGIINVTQALASL
jgi:subtilisin family serine protease